MNFITQFVPETFVKALGWTLLHSLWQGALVALLLGLLMIVLKRHSATLRYFTAVTALATVFVMSVATFYRYSQTEALAAAQIHPAKVMQAAGYPITLEMGSSQTKLPSSSGSSFFSAQAFSDYFEQHFPLIVTVWLLGILALTLRLLGGLAYVQRLKHYKTQLAAAHWQNRLEALQQKIQLSRPVQLLESALVKVPMVIGYLKPVILLPVGTLTGLSPAQVEAVIAHELAHIYRSDYVVNLLQSIIEIIFFFHPAVWWMSAQIRQEREHCCDDLAIHLSGDSVAFARALASLEELHWESPRLAMAATGSKGVLFGRIKRLLTATKRTPTFAEGFLAAFVLLMGVAAVSVSAQGSGLQLQAFAAEKATDFSRQTAPDLIYSEAKSNVANGDRQAIYLQLEDSTRRKTDVIIVKDKTGNIIELYVDGKRIPDNKIKEYQDRINESLRTQKQAKKDYSDQPEKDVEKALAAIEQTQDDFGNVLAAPVVAPMPPMPPFPSVAPMPPAPPVDMEDEEAEEAYEKAVEKYEEARERYEQKVEEVTEAYVKANENVIRQHESQLRKQESLVHRHEEDVRKREEEVSNRAERIREETRQKQERQMQEHEKMREARQREHERMQEARQKEHESRQRAHEKQMQEHEAKMKVYQEKQEEFMKILKAELKKDGFNPDGKLELELSKDNLEINDKKQSDELYQKYRKLIEENTGASDGKFKDNAHFQLKWD